GGEEQRPVVELDGEEVRLGNRRVESPKRVADLLRAGTVDVRAEADRCEGLAFHDTAVGRPQPPVLGVRDAWVPGRAEEAAPGRVGIGRGHGPLAVAPLTA